MKSEINNLVKSPDYPLVKKPVISKPMQSNSDQFYLEILPNQKNQPIIKLNQGFCGFDFRPSPPLTSSQIFYNLGAPQATYLYPTHN